MINCGGSKRVSTDRPFTKERISSHQTLRHKKKDGWVSTAVHGGRIYDLDDDNGEEDVQEMKEKRKEKERAD